MRSWTTHVPLTQSNPFTVMAYLADQRNSEVSMNLVLLKRTRGPIVFIARHKISLIVPANLRDGRRIAQHDVEVPQYLFRDFLDSEIVIISFSFVEE